MIACVYYPIAHFHGGDEGGVFIIILGVLVALYLLKGLSGDKRP
jgi:hypothetical protein